MTEDQLPDDTLAAEPERLFDRLVALVPSLDEDELRDLDEMVEGVTVGLGNAVDLNARLFSGDAER